jgi:hypothetical protein
MKEGKNREKMKIERTLLQNLYGTEAADPNTCLGLCISYPTSLKNRRKLNHAENRLHVGSPRFPRVRYDLK